MSKKRKSPDEQDFEESPPAGCSDEGRAQKWKCRSWTVAQVLLCDSDRIPLMFVFARLGHTLKVHNNYNCCVWPSWIHRLAQEHAASINSPTQIRIIIPRKQSCVSRGLLFIISHQFPVKSDLCDMMAGCRTDFNFQIEGSTGNANDTRVNWGWWTQCCMANITLLIQKLVYVKCKMMALHLGNLSPVVDGADLLICTVWMYPVGSSVTTCPHTWVTK